MAFLDKLILNEGEELVSVTRAHWLAVLAPYVIIALIFLAPFFFLWPLFQFGSIGVYVFFVIIFIAIFLAARENRRWQRSMLVLTSTRLLWFEQKGFFDRTVTETFYQNIQDISYRIKGFFQTMAHFGSLRVQIAGASGPLEIKYLPNPDKIQHVILDFREQKRAVVSGADNEWWEDRISAMSKEERQIFFSNIRNQIGEEAWYNLFRPKTQSSVKDRNLPEALL
ncbi:hypothetical protein A3H10_02140 [Candidatus Uhrbacteria bacterium RIFCSPLOWO2_12_FULL_46_10]|uniref:YdbS-like PH domain-containing protein n=1 Tax=Candidatus Uhrbacteria bacterium RIFCSPLOWO2_01_FULL_47_25 TaxID=1802402 RepID=A0A1F7UXI1_9BACT|nr:MAG: hypothetical protein UX68_C0032G0014 [Parcubacteria group bacterium GW2011_GWA2_46_9]OGL60684.1 MAG: hypothetical protein A2752_04295 [Candidatus Uhrbacteria bacterium RIFCSPHIGHO2_01_FULL_46_23]OGL70315.1 MAG: hypothetical protein A3D60_01810 [Candidatus Uhrbacteria bacterium RIFCSPHIGHO2_02_FULL_47_29]OGL75101.1 MAG: hypothetical protein A3E96_01840 [Candidatus Uhrbacteria bacterium RIFCSPHIGHO2_12_FULL_46_13]OGL83002.1 MAG: hypothetical protein A2936_03555 [Candidatus Uhrbacteria bac